MCKAWDDHKLSGIREGKIESKIDLIMKKIKKGYTIEQIADVLEDSVEGIKPIYDIITSSSADYDAEQVYKILTQTATAV